MFPTSPKPIVSKSKIIRLDNLLVDKEIENDLICSICSCLLVDNRQGCKEGHVFCLSCITTWLEKSKTCPCCRSEINSTEILSKNRYIDKGIEKLKIYCPNKFKNYENVGDDPSLELIEEKYQGCNEIITIGEKKLHLENCKFKLVNCENFGCTLKIRLNQLEHHMNQECDFKLVKCKHRCSLSPHFKKDIASHEETCSFRYIICKNKSCGKSMRFYQFKVHIDSFCIFELIECEFKDGGCSSKFGRGKKDQHYSSINHTQYASKIINDQKLLLSKTMDKLSKLQLEFNKYKELKSKEEIKKVSNELKNAEIVEKCSPPSDVKIYTNKMYGNSGRIDDIVYWINPEDDILRIKSLYKKKQLIEVEIIGPVVEPLKRGVQIHPGSDEVPDKWLYFFKIERAPLGFYKTNDIIIKVTNIE